MITTKSRIEGMFLGIAIGDALGMPVEGMTYTAVQDMLSNSNLKSLDRFLPPSEDRNWGDDVKAGMWTDDTQLTIATAKSLIESKGLDIQDQAQKLVEAFDDTIRGWGRSTRNSAQRLKQGVLYDESGESNPGLGCGNGIVMKIAPIGAYLRSLIQGDRDYTHVFSKIREFSSLTHRTEMGLESGFSHVLAIDYCLGCEGEVNNNVFLMTISDALKLSYINLLSYQNLSSYKFVSNFDMNRLQERFESLWEYEDFKDSEDIAYRYGCGSCYVYNSLPFVYAFFLRHDPKDPMQSIYDIASTGGDTDTNASILGGMLGALYGVKIFPQELIDDLYRSEYILSIADDFYDEFYK